jgi:hypothetical protein
MQVDAPLATSYGLVVPRRSRVKMMNRSHHCTLRLVSTCVWLVSACALDDRTVGVVDVGGAPSSPSDQGVVSEPDGDGSDEDREDDVDPMDPASAVGEDSGDVLPLDTADNPSGAPPSGSAPSGGAQPVETAPPSSMTPSSMPPASTPPPQPAPAAPAPQDQDVTITLIGAGRVTSSPAGIDCPGTCTSRFAGGSTVTFSAEGVPAGDDYFAGWRGDCTGFDDCSLSIDRAHTVSAAFGPANIAFVTADLVNPTQLGGLAGADRFCQARATAAGLPGTYVAWLSNSTADAVDRVQGVGARGWVRPDGLEVGDTIDGMLAGEMFHPVRMDEAGVAFGDISDLGDDNTLTGTNPDGRWSGDSCGNWNDATAEVTLGATSSVGAFFTNVVTADCSGAGARPSSLLCFGTDRAVRVVPRRQSGRLAFISDGLFTPGSGIAAADALCVAEAQALGRSGTFRAALALAGTLPEQRFNLNASPWVRVDGVLLADTAAGFFLDDFRRSPLNVTASGRYVSTTLWFGRSRTGQADNDTTCMGWTSATATGLMQQATTTEPLQATIPVSCTSSAPIICLEN